MSNDNIIKVRNVNYHYDHSNRNALNNVNLNVHRGEWLSIIGRNGSGKSTLIRAIDHLISVDSGDITIADNESANTTIGMVFQNPDDQFVGSNVEDDIAFGLENYNVPQLEMQSIIDEALLAVGMNNYNHRTPAELSGGQKQRVALAGIIAVKPAVIILDEATSMLDPHGRKDILTLINELRLKEQITIIAITHDASELSYADRIILMDSGQIISEQTTQQTFQNLSMLKEMGLSIPYSEKLRLKLLSNGFKMPDRYLDREELVNWIMQLNLKR